MALRYTSGSFSDINGEKPLGSGLDIQDFVLEEPQTGRHAYVYCLKMSGCWVKYMDNGEHSETLNPYTVLRRWKVVCRRSEYQSKSS